MSDKKLIQLVEKTGLEPAQQKPLLDNFGGFFVEAHKLVALAKGIKVTSIDQIDEMKKAHEIRMKLMKIRTDADRARISLKEGYLRGANAVQGIYNDIRDIVKSEEERLLEQEKFAENQKKLALDKIEFERKQKLLKYTENISFYDLRNMDEQTFNQVLESSKQLFENKKAAEEKAEKERIEAERKEELYRGRLMVLAPIAKFQPRPISIDTDEREYQEILRVSRAGAEKYELEQEQIRIQNEKLLKEKQKLEEARLKAEDELKKQQEAIAEQKRKEEAEKLAKEEAEKMARAEAEEKERQKLLAPDKEKLIDLAKIIDLISLPAVQSNEAQSVVRATKDMLNKVSSYIQEKAKTL